MNKLRSKQDEARHRLSINSARSPDRLQPFYCLLKTVLLGITTLYIVVIVPASMALGESPGRSTGAEAKYEEVLRRVQALEERLRKSEGMREHLTEEVQRLKADLQAEKSGKQVLEAPETTASQPRPQLQIPEALEEEPPSAEMPAPSGPLGGITAGWDKGFYIRSKDGNFEFWPIGILQVDFRGHEDERQINTDDTLASTFDIRRLRLGFEGFMFRDIGYTFEVNFDEGETELIYAYLNFGYIPWANLRVGQFKEPFNYEVLYPEKFLDFVERAMIATLGPAEDIGIMVHNLRNPYAGLFEYGIGVFNGNSIHLNNSENNDFEGAARVAVLPFANGADWLKKTKFAINATYSGEQRREFGFRPRTSEGFEFFPRLAVNGERLRWGGDLQWYYGPFSLKAAYVRAEEGRSDGLPNLISDGWHVDGTWVITGQEKKLAMESGWELAARYQEMQVNAQKAFAIPGYVDVAGKPVLVTDNRVRSFTFGLNKYFNYNIKFQINYERDWFANTLLTPTSRHGGILSPGDDTVDTLLARLQLFF